MTMWVDTCFRLQSQLSDAHQLLLQLGKYGDNGPDGNHTVFNMETILAIKNENFVFDQAANKGVRSVYFHRMRSILTTRHSSIFQLDECFPPMLK